MKVGDCVVKSKGASKGRVGIITRIYEGSRTETHVVLEILSEGEVIKWSSTWCNRIGVDNESR